MKIDQLFQFIVPLTFLAIWALTSLFNRESQPLPPRASRSPDPFGPRPPAPSPTPRAVERPAGFPPREPTLRWNTPGVAPSGTGRPLARPDDDIVILESETRRPSPPPSPRPTGGTPVRRPSRVKTPAPAPPKRQEHSSQHGLSTTVSASLQSQMTRPLELKSLSVPSTRVEVPLPARAAELKAAPGARSPADFQSLARSLDRVRESFVMNEILQPPLSLRRGRRHSTFTTRVQPTPPAE